MAKFRQVHTTFWEDPKVTEDMTPEDKYFYLYLLTNPNTTQIGVYQITKKKMAFDLGYSIESIRALMERFIEKHSVIHYNEETREVALLNWGKYNLNKSGKPVMDLMKKELGEVKDTTMLKEIAKNIENEKVNCLFKAFFDDPSTTRGTRGGQEEEQEQEEQEQEEQEEGEQEQEDQEQKCLAGSRNAHTFYQNNIGPLSPFISEQITSYCEDSSDELVIMALKIALEKQKQWDYTKGILNKWFNTNVKTIEQAEAAQERYRKQHKGSQPPNDMAEDEYDKLF